ncbi:MAG: alkylphosphonate utilization protein [Mariprofundaceae bacterium]|nr:alkylphosphonate utilization protein [Mariprofundaceae bacterium]
MSIEETLQARSESKCELCAATESLSVYEVPASPDTTADQCVLLCATCQEQIEDATKVDANHWRCLNDSMWSQVPAVQVMAFRMLNRLRGEGWPQDLLDMMYLEDDVKAWAEAGLETESSDEAVVHRDSNGAILANGDTVIVIKDLKVSGGGFTAKRGTAIRNIRLVADNPLHIEGRVNGQQLVLLTEFMKKA